MKQYYVYILTNKQDGTLYIGVTSNLRKRIWDHKNKAVDGFTKKYNLDRLVYFETYDCVENAILREKRMKKWERSWKVERIQERNPEWKDLYETLV